MVFFYLRFFKSLFLPILVNCYCEFYLSNCSCLHWLDLLSNHLFQYNGVYWVDLMLSICDLIVIQKPNNEEWMLESFFVCLFVCLLATWGWVNGKMTQLKGDLTILLSPSTDMWLGRFLHLNNLWLHQSLVPFPWQARVCEKIT